MTHSCCDASCLCQLLLFNCWLVIFAGCMPCKCTGLEIFAAPWHKHNVTACVHILAYCTKHASNITLILQPWPPLHPAFLKLVFFAALHVISVSWVALEVDCVTLVLGCEGEIVLSVPSLVDFKNKTIDCWHFCFARSLHRARAVGVGAKPGLWTVDWFMDSILDSYCGLILFK